MSVRYYGPGYQRDGAVAYATDGTPSAALYVGSNAPGQPLVGDLWIDGASGNTTLSAKGDLLGYTGSVETRVPVGADGLFLVADSTSATGLSWASVVTYIDARITNNTTIQTSIDSTVNTAVTNVLTVVQATAADNQIATIMGAY